MPAKRDTGGHILTEWPFCYVKSAIEHKRRYAYWFEGGRQYIFVLNPHSMSEKIIPQKNTCNLRVNHEIKMFIYHFWRIFIVRMHFYIPTGGW